MRTRLTALALGGLLLAAACSTQTGQSPGSVPPLGTSQATGAPPPTAAAFRWAPEGLAFGPDGILYASDCVGGRIYRVDPAGMVTVFAGTGVSSTSGGPTTDGVPATQADLHCPMGLAFDSAGSLLVVEHASNRIRAIGVDGIINTRVGNGPVGTSVDDGELTGDGGPAREAHLQEPTTITFDAAGNLYIADRDNHAIRRVDVAGIITTVAGSGDRGFTGDDERATEAELSRPQGVAVDAAGNIYISDSENNRIRKVDTSGIITTIAGTGEPGYSGDGGPALDATIVDPYVLLVDGAGNLRFSSSGNVIRMIDANGIISTVAGTGEGGFSGDGGPATAAQLAFPTGLVFDAAGNLYIGEVANQRIRIVRPDGTIGTFAPAGT
jgi:sugar lactone lactonase YvrE